MRKALRLVAVGLSVAACSLATSGCSGTERRIEQEAEKLVSAARTTALLAREWAGGRVPDAYAGQMARIVGEQLVREPSLPVWREADPQIRQSALDGAAAARRLAERLETAVVERNVGEAAAVAVESADLARDLSALTDRSAEQSQESGS